MSDLGERLREAAYEPQDLPDVAAIRRRVARRRRRRAIARIATVTVMAVGVATAMLLSLRSGDSVPIVPPPASTEAPTTSAAPTTTVVPTTTVAPLTSSSTTTSSTTSPPTTVAPIVTGPNGLRAVSVQILGPAGVPFPKGTVIAQACPTSVIGESSSTDVSIQDNQPCVFSTVADGTGATQRFELDPALTYELTAMARDTGWPNPWISPSGEPFHFSDHVIASGANLEEGTVLALDQFPTSDLDNRGKSSTSAYSAEFETCRSDPGAQTVGDNTGCDALHSACQDSDLLACNDLYYSAAWNSAYESFGASCGNRIQPADYQWGGYCGESPESPPSG